MVQINTKTCAHSNYANTCTCMSLIIATDCSETQLIRQQTNLLFETIHLHNYMYMYQNVSVYLKNYNIAFLGIKHTIVIENTNKYLFTTPDIVCNVHIQIHDRTCTNNNKQSRTNEINSNWTISYNYMYMYM